jgi:hypothetical protein
MAILPGTIHGDTVHSYYVDHHGLDFCAQGQSPFPMLVPPFESHLS